MMLAIVHLLGMYVADLFKSRRRLEVENLFLRHQLNIVLRRTPQRIRLRGGDRALLVWMTRRWPSLLGLARVVQPDTILRWHRAGFKAYWRWKSQGRAGRPRIERELRDLIRRMSKENPLWGAPRIHGELLKLGFEIAKSTVSKYMIRRRGPPSQNWRTFLCNHADAIAAIDLCVVPTLTFERLFAFLVLGHGRRQLLWFAVTRHPTAEWLAQQIVEAFPWNTAPTYLVRDNDGAYGHAFTRRLRTMGIRDRPISPRSPWQNAYAERLIGTLRRDCLDHVLIFGERHLRQILTLYSSYYNETRTHLSLGQGCAAATSGPSQWDYCRYAHSVRAAPSVRADMIFGKDTRTHLSLDKDVQTPGLCTDLLRARSSRSPRSEDCIVATNAAPPKLPS